MASEYGWSKKEILEDTYFDELYYLTEKIKTRRVRNWQIQLAIAQNHHTKDPKALWDNLRSMDDTVYEEDDGKAGIETLKRALQQSSNFVVK